VLAEPEDVANAVRSSFEDVYAAESRAIVSLAALLVGSQAVAEELAQDAFLRLFEHFDDVTNPAGFLRTVVVRLCLTWQKRRTTEQRLVRQVGVDRPSSIPEVDETWAALGRLDPDRRVVLVLRYYCQLRHHEIAELLGCPASTVRTRTRRALRDLRKELAR
jgi:RNA polymerase sigma-70 factor, ECF subfamily